MPQVERTDPDGVDFGWVMQTTFVLTVLVGAPAVAVLSLSTAPSTWTARALFAVRVGAVVWLVAAVGVYLYARRTGAGDGEPVSGDDDGDEEPTDATDD